MFDLEAFVAAYPTTDRSKLSTSTGIGKMVVHEVTPAQCQVMVASLRRYYADPKQAAAIACHASVFQETDEALEDIPEDAIAWFHYCLMRAALEISATPIQNNDGSI